MTPTTPGPAPAAQREHQPLADLARAALACLKQDVANHDDPHAALDASAYLVSALHDITTTDSPARNNLGAQRIRHWMTTPQSGDLTPPRSGGVTS